MNGVLLQAGRAEASLTQSAYKSVVKNHWSPGPISLSLLLGRAKNALEAENGSEQTHVPAHSVGCLNWCLRNKSQ